MINPYELQKCRCTKYKLCWRKVGSTTAAQFLQRFILNKTPWAHLEEHRYGFQNKWRSLNWFESLALDY